VLTFAVEWTKQKHIKEAKPSFAIILFSSVVFVQGGFFSVFVLIFPAANNSLL
jgi:hypothetical protein